jgi:hypothetical protein
MACKGCEQRRATMLLMAEAGKQWTSNPTGPNIREIFYKLRAEAIARGELDGRVEPKQD